MNKYSLPSNELPVLRSVVWIAIAASALLFWLVVAAMVIAWLR